MFSYADCLILFDNLRGGSSEFSLSIGDETDLISLSKELLVIGNGSDDSCITKSSITCVSTCGLTMAFGGHLSLISSAVAAIGRPDSVPFIVGNAGTVPGIGVGCRAVLASIPLIIGLISACWGKSFVSFVIEPRT